MNASHLYATPAESNNWLENNISNVKAGTKTVVHEVLGNGATAVKPMVRTASTIIRRAM